MWQEIDLSWQAPSFGSWASHGARIEWLPVSEGLACQQRAFPCAFPIVFPYAFPEPHSFPNNDGRESR